MNTYQPPMVPPREVDVSDPVAVAADLLGRIASYDQTAPQPTRELLSDWAGSIYAAGIPYEFLVAGVHQVFVAAGGEPPKSKLAAVIGAARALRADSRKGEVLQELGPAPSFDDDAPEGYAIPEAYEANGEIGLACGSVTTEVTTHHGCGARPGEACESGGKVRRIPCTARLILAARVNDPNHRIKHEARQAHLAEHRKTYKPGWT